MAYADTLCARALDATGTLTAITVVEAALPSRALHGDIVIVVTRMQGAAADTI